MAQKCELGCFLVCICLPAVASFLFGLGEEGLFPCGEGSFQPKTQCCCRQTVHQIPESDCQCCLTEAYRRNETKPDFCTGLCGKATFHTGLQATQMCCDGHVVDLSTNPGVARFQVCCAQQVMNTATHECCHGFPMNKSDSRYGCCKGHLPYHRDTMRCYTSTDTVMMRSKITFSSQQFCDGDLPEWDTAMPLPTVRNNSMIHVRGIPEQCSLRIRNNSRNGRQIEIRLNPFVVVGQDIDHVCANSFALLLVIKLQAGQDCASESQLKAHLHGVALDIFARKQIVCSKAEDGMSVLRLKDGHKAVVFVSKHAQTILRKSLT